MEASIRDFVPEVWVNISGWEGYYQVSNYGNVRSCLRWIIRSDETVAIIPSKIQLLKLSSGNRRYYGSGRRLYASLSRNGCRATVLVNRLVAKAFIPNLENKPEVNHINTNPLDNTVWNLEWATKRENMDHATRLGLIGRSHRIIRHIVRCRELGITTIGIGRMCEILKGAGYRPFFTSVLRCVHGTAKSHRGLTFASLPVSVLGKITFDEFCERLEIPKNA